MANASYDYLFKLLLIGDSGVGKTCLLLRYADDVFHPTFITTLGCDFRIRTIELDGKKIKLQLWDTVGQESYFRGAMGIMLVYDIADTRSFQNIENWMRSIQEKASSDVEKMIIGNKCDLDELRKISKETGQQLADEFNVHFFEASAKTGINVEESFLTMARAIRSNVDRKTAGVSEARGQESPSSISVTARAPPEVYGEAQENKQNKSCCAS